MRMKDHLGILFYIKLSEKLMGEKGGKWDNILVFFFKGVRVKKSMVARKFKD